MARRKITQQMADGIREDYEAVIAGTSDRTLADVQDKWGIARTTLYDLRNKGWNVLAAPPRSNGNRAPVEQLLILSKRVEALEEEMRFMRQVIQRIDSGTDQRE